MTLAIEYINAEEINEHPSVPNIRSSIRKDEIRELVESIKSDGLRVPINCFREDGNIYLVNGWRRKSAIDIILKEDPVSPARKVPVIFLKYEHDSMVRDALCDNLVDNIHRQDVNPYDTAKRIKLLADMGIDNQTICRKLNKSIAWLHDMFNLLESDETVMESLRAGDLNITEAKEISKLPKEKQSTVTEGLVEAKKTKNTEAEAKIRKKTKEAGRVQSHESVPKKEIKYKWRLLNDISTTMKKTGDDRKKKDSYLMIHGAYKALSWVLGYRKELNVEKIYKSYFKKSPEHDEIEKVSTILRKSH